MRKAKYRALTDREVTELVNRLHSEGQTWGAVAREVGVSRPVVVRWSKRTFEDGGPPTDTNTPPSFGVPERESESMDEREREIEERVRTRDRMAAVETGLGKLQEEVGQVRKALGALTRQPLVVERDGNHANVSCPTCGTHAMVATQLDAEDFDAVLSEFDRAHRKSPTGKALDCPDCRPKIDQKLREMGYALQKTQPTRR